MTQNCPFGQASLGPHKSWGPEFRQKNPLVVSIQPWQPMAMHSAEFVQGLAQVPLLSSTVPDGHVGAAVVVVVVGGAVVVVVVGTAVVVVAGGAAVH